MCSQRDGYLAVDLMDVFDGIDGFLALNKGNKPDTYGPTVFSVSGHLPGFTD